MESTEVHWIPLCHVWDERGVEVALVNAERYRNAPGRKTDVCDAAWLQYLYVVGLLRSLFRPAQEVCAAPTSLRRRWGLVEAASKRVRRMQKALDQRRKRTPKYNAGESSNRRATGALSWSPQLPRRHVFLRNELEPPARAAAGGAQERGAAAWIHWGPRQEAVPN